MIIYCIHRINRKISELYLFWKLNVVSIDQITFKNEFYFIDKKYIETIR